jgi:hypothetical protein
MQCGPCGVAGAGESAASGGQKTIFTGNHSRFRVLYLKSQGII